MDLQVAIVVVSHNTRGLLLECLASVIESTQGRNAQVVVVDNSSEDGSYEAAFAAYPHARFIQNSTNLGFGAACNQGIKATGAPFILLLNSDARLTAQAFHALCDCLEQNERCGAAGCKLIDAAGTEVINTRNFLTPFNQAFELTGIEAGLGCLQRTRRPNLGRNLADCSVDWIDGACLMLRRAALDEAGFFDERFFMYSEDEDLCFRLRKRGWLVCFCGAGTAVHHGAASSRLNRIDMLRHFYLSQMLFLSKHRSHQSACFYAVLMKTVLVLKHSLLRDGHRRETALEQLMALNEACAARNRKK
jgi:GT2 family glycosyltransferase